MKRIFLDTNIYVIGQLKPLSPEDKLLTWLGFYDSINKSIEKRSPVLVVSPLGLIKLIMAKAITTSDRI